MQASGTLNARFSQLIGSYSNDPSTAQKLWLELDTAYSSPSRHYHSWQHIERLCDDIVADISDDKTCRLLLLAAFYHDVVYDVLKHDNEEQSADLAAKRMQEIGVPDPEARLSCDCILATKSHADTGNDLIGFFTDVDLSILGASPEGYKLYTQQIRSEYSIYPDEIYKPGRGKVIEHFLSAPRIYKTDVFYNRLEAAARANLAIEYALLEQ